MALFKWDLKHRCLQLASEVGWAWRPMDRFGTGGWEATDYGKCTSSEWRPQSLWQEAVRSQRGGFMGKFYQWASPILYFWPVVLVDHFRGLNGGLDGSRHISLNPTSQGGEGINKPSKGIRKSKVVVSLGVLKGWLKWWYQRWDIFTMYKRLYVTKTLYMECDLT